MSARPDAGAAEMVRVRPIDGRFAFVSLRVDGWSTTGIVVQRTDAGHRITWPFTESGGERRPIVTPPPPIREQLEAEIAEAVAAALADRGARP